MLKVMSLLPAMLTLGVTAIAGADGHGGRVHADLTALQGDGGVCESMVTSMGDGGSARSSEDDAVVVPLDSGYCDYEWRCAGTDCDGFGHGERRPFCCGSVTGCRYTGPWQRTGVCC